MTAGKQQACRSSLGRRVVAERVGTALPLPTAIGSGIIAERLAGREVAVAPRPNTPARAGSDTFAGIRPADVPGFIAAQTVGAIAATLLFRWLLPAPAPGDQAQEDIA